MGCTKARRTRNWTALPGVRECPGTFSVAEPPGMPSTVRTVCRDTGIQRVTTGVMMMVSGAAPTPEERLLGDIARPWVVVSELELGRHMTARLPLGSEPAQAVLHKDLSSQGTCFGPGFTT